MNSPIETVVLLFPDDAQAFFEPLSDLLLELPNAKRSDPSAVVLTPTQPTGAYPTTVFRLADVPYPQVRLEPSTGLTLQAGNLCVNPTDDLAAECLDWAGPQPSPHPCLDIADLTGRLSGHVVRLDHTGINLPADLVAGQWPTFLAGLACQANLYRYPTSEPWLFVVPATPVEFSSDVSSFPLGREPRFEFVYESSDIVPSIQIDIETDLSSAEAEELLPAPYGFSLPNLGGFFRTVYVRHDWPGLWIRFDVRFRVEAPGDWETGRWLIKEGGRVTCLPGRGL